MSTVAAQQHVTLSSDIKGRYVVAGEQPDGELRLVPDTSITAIHKRPGTRRLTEDEWQDFLAEHGPHLQPPDGEGKSFSDFSSEPPKPSDRFQSKTTCSP